MKVSYVVAASIFSSSVIICLTISNALGVGGWNPIIVRNSEYITQNAEQINKNAEKITQMYLRRENEIATVHQLILAIEKNIHHLEAADDIHREIFVDLQGSDKRTLETWTSWEDRLREMAWDVDDLNIQMLRSSQTVEVSKDYPNDRLPPGVQYEDTRENPTKGYVYLAVDLGNGRELRTYASKADDKGAEATTEAEVQSLEGEE